MWTEQAFSSKFGHTRWLALFVAIAAMYVLTSSGRIASGDGLAMFNVTGSLAQEGTLSSDPCTPTERNNDCVPGVDGRHYAGFGLAPSIVSVPAYAAGAQIASLLHRDPRLLTGFSVSLSHAIFSALAPVLLALWLSELGISWFASASAALVLAFVTPFWFAATKVFCSEPYFILGLLGCCYLLTRGDGTAYCVGAGAAFGFAIASRVYGLILAPALAGYALLIWKSRGVSRNEITKNLLWFGSGAGLLVVLVALSNLMRFGSIFKTGYHLQFPSVGELLANPLLRGMGDLLTDGEVGLLIFTPWILALILIWSRFWRKFQNEAILVLAIALINYVFFAKYTAWRGGFSFGPRLLLPIIPYLVLPLAVWFDEKRGLWRTTAQRVTMTLLAATFLIQLATAPYPFARYYSLRQEARLEGRGNEWWIQKPILKAVVDLPKLFSPSSENADDLRDRQFLSSFPNGVNLLTPDFWVWKASMFGIPRPLLGGIALALLSAFGWALWRVYRPYRYSTPHAYAAAP